MFYRKKKYFSHVSVFRISVILLFYAFMILFMKSRYDMEDAMILNKSSVDRGMFHGQIYQVCSCYTTYLKIADKQENIKLCYSEINLYFCC